MHWLESWLLPPKCVLTGELTVDIDISAKLVNKWPVPKKVCPQCCELTSDGLLCGTCLANPPAFERTQVGFYFDEELMDLIHGLKYQSKPAYARILAELLTDKLDVTGVEAVVAVPLFKNRFRDRGFNQAELIAESLAKTLNIPLIKQAVFRVKDTPSQTHLNARQRRSNLKNAFEVKADRFADFKRVALLDDVITTGATMQSLAQEIKKQTSVEIIQAWAVAKTK
ncbi:MAG: ComF family protein [Pseudomonadota bacterium]|nr:ComF family protein [Pseudomonadota bacterium]